jgi:tetratricopeptide (TPR) repeat protein
LRIRLLLSACVLLAFGGSLAGEFQFDDFALLADPAIASAAGWRESWRLEQTRPLTWFSFWLSYQLGGETPAGYRAVSLGLHLAVTLLLGATLAKLIPPRAALAAAAVFAVHPALAEPVNYIFARGTLLAALFSLLAIRAWIDRRAWVAALWFAAGMLAKEECSAVPLFLALLDWRRSAKLRRFPVAVMLAVALALGLRAVWAAAVVPGSEAGSQAGISPARYFAAQGVVIWTYLRRLIVPWGFSPDYDVPQPPLWLAAAAWAGLAVLAVLALRRAGDAGAWFASGLLLLVPSSSVFPAADLAADRRLYLPMLALSASLGLLIARFHPRALAASVLVLAAISFRYTTLWRTPHALWEEAAARAPNKIRPRIHLARASAPMRALELLEEARRLAPSDPAIPAEQGRVLLAAGRPAEALEAFGRALALEPGSAAALNNRGAALAALGQAAAARADFERALARDPCLFDARLNLFHMGVSVPSPASCRYTSSQRALLP